MEGTVKRVLFVNSEMSPYVETGEISATTLAVSQKMQEAKLETRSFMPRYGLINERKNQLHEVIRLSGMNIVIGDVDRPLIIKVASLPAARMQVYFIDNEDFFHRKALYTDNKGEFFKDNGDRAVFFARGVLETVKKLRWSPDIIHCSGWISHVLPLYLKKSYKDDPIFFGSKVVLSLFGDTPQKPFVPTFAEDVRFKNITDGDLAVLSEPTGINLARMAISNSDGVIMASADAPAALADFAREKAVPVLEYNQSAFKNGGCTEAYRTFYESLK